VPRAARAYSRPLTLEGSRPLWLTGGTNDRTTIRPSDVAGAALQQPLGNRVDDVVVDGVRARLGPDQAAHRAAVAAVQAGGARPGNENLQIDRRWSQASSPYYAPYRT
jgi:hypothetical protein